MIIMPSMLLADMLPMLHQVNLCLKVHCSNSLLDLNILELNSTNNTFELPENSIVVFVIMKKMRILDWTAIDNGHWILEKSITDGNLRN